MSSINNSNEDVVLSQKHPKIDPITALQEGIDGLSLAMFEALRGLRDAATLDGETTDNIDSSVDNSVNANPNNMSDLPQQQQQDSELVQKLVDAVFEKSYAIDEMLDNSHVTMNNIKIPPLYTTRTKGQQMEYIEKLVKENNAVIEELHIVVQETIQQRNLCRQYIIDKSDVTLLSLQNDIDNDE